MVGLARGLTSDERADEAIRLSVILGGESVLVNGVIKSFFRRDRPVWEQTTRLPHPAATQQQLPQRPRQRRLHGRDGPERRRLPPALYYAAAAVVASSRIYVKIHHPSDVVAGIATGLVIGRVARPSAWPKIRNVPGIRCVARHMTLSSPSPGTTAVPSPATRTSTCSPVRPAVQTGTCGSCRSHSARCTWPKASIDVWDEPEKDTGLVALQAGVIVRDRFPDQFRGAPRLFAARHDEGLKLKDPDVVRNVLSNNGVDADEVFAAIDDGTALKQVRDRARGDRRQPQSGACRPSSPATKPCSFASWTAPRGHRPATRAATRSSASSRCSIRGPI